MPHKKETYKDECYGNEVREKILEFANRGWDGIPAEEREEWFTRFKFWGVFHQRSGQESYFMMRLTNCGGVLEPGQLRAIGEVARDFATGPVDNPEWGNGFVDFTTRQSVQLHWLNLEDVPAIWKKLESVGVTSRSAGGDTMRNISGCPVAGKAPEFVESRPILDEIQETIRGDDDLCNMPRKFNISVSGCKQGCSMGAINDIELEPAYKDDGAYEGAETRREGFNVRVGGGLGGREPRRARSLDLFVEPNRAVETVRAFVEHYHETGNRENRSKNRARFFVDEHGTDAIRDALVDRLNFEPERAGPHFREEYTYNAGRAPTDGPHDHVGVYEQRDGLCYIGLSVPVGRLTAKETIALADLAEEYGSGEIRLTRRQNPIIMDVPESNVAPLLAEPLLQEHKPEPNPFVRGAQACTGTEFCSLALTETKVRMAELLRWLRANVELPDDVSQLKIHYSGCTADCGQAMIADVGLQGMRARKDDEIVEALDVGVGGGLGTKPTFVDWIHQRVPADEVPGLLRDLFQTFAAHREPGQPFREWIEKTGVETVVDLTEPTETDYEDPCLYDAKQSWYPFDDGPSPAPTRADGSPIPSDD